MLTAILLVGGSVAWAARVWLRLMHFLHILQLEGYKSPRFAAWLAEHPLRLLDRRELGLEALLGVAALIVWVQVPGEAGLALLAGIWAACGVILSIPTRKPKPKKPLVFTARAIRLVLFAAALSAWVVLAWWMMAERLVWSLPRPSPELRAFVSFSVSSALLSQLAADVVLLANLAAFPLERAVQQVYLRSARRRLGRTHPRVVGITGSYGKTSTKYFLASILSRRFSVLATRESYNTPMGICKVIRGELSSSHEVFIVEMGAYRRGDIRELCRLVRPEVGILTAVGPQHLERFGSMENIARTKYELIEALPPGGLAVFNGDDPISEKLASETMGRREHGLRVLRYGCESGAEVSAWAVEVSFEGLSFKVSSGSRGPVSFETRVLGRQNVSNILAATAVALELGMELEEIGQAVKLLEAPPHRLQLIGSPLGVTVIDDAYNSNPVGAQAALELLGLVKSGARILVTPGMVELGAREAEENRRLGALAARVADLVILVGPARTLPIREGLLEAGVPSERILAVRSLAEARERLKSLLKSGDTVLFENDLPDQYADA